MSAGVEALQLCDMERLQNDLALTEFAGEVVQRRLTDLVATLEGERGVMLGLLRELLSVVETIEAESDDEALRLWVLRQKTTRLLILADCGA